MARDPVMKPGAARPSEKYRFYDCLMSLTLRHDFYDGDLFPDFVIVPTAPTQALLHNLGLIARPRRAGIDILYQTGRSAAIVRYLHDHRRQRRAGKPSSLDEPDYNKPSTYQGCWSRLTLTLSLENNLFTNFTALPLVKAPDGSEVEIMPGEQALYLSNRNTTEAHGRHTQLNRSERVASVPITTFSPAHFHFEVPSEATEFILYDTSGRAILRADPDYLPKDKPHRDELTEIPPRAHLRAGGDLHISMANERPGLFSYEIKNKDDALLKKEEFFYAGTLLTPLLFVDLFLASPDEPDAGCYPIVLPEQLGHEPTQAAANAAAQKYITPHDYEIRFKARKTIWTYYIVLPSGEAASKDLAIRAEPQDSLEFHGPVDVRLPTGVSASCFTARKAVPLRYRSDISLRLQSGGVPGNGSARILLERLPTPSAERIGLRPRSTGGTATSEVFVYL